MKRTIAVALILFPVAANAAPICQTVAEVAPKGRTVVRAGIYAATPNHIVMAGQLDDGQYLAHYLMPVHTTMISADLPDSSKFTWENCLGR